MTVSASGVEHPVMVEYAWADNPDQANLYNKAGLPAVPFRVTVAHDDPSGDKGNGKVGESGKAEGGK